MALLGWGPPDDIEVRPIEEIISLFELTDVNPSSAMFDLKKLEAINAEYIRAMSPEDFSHALTPWIKEESWGAVVGVDELRKVAPLIQERTKVLSEGPGHLDFFFLTNPEFDEAAWTKVMRSDEAPLILSAVKTAVAEVEWDSTALHEMLRSIGEQHGMKLGKAQAPLRVAITGRSVGPPLFESMQFLGRETVVQRITAAQQKLDTNKPIDSP